MEEQGKKFLNRTYIAQSFQYNFPDTFIRVCKVNVYYAIYNTFLNLSEFIDFITSSGQHGKVNRFKVTKGQPTENDDWIKKNIF